MTEFTQPFNDDKWMNLTNEKMVSCADHGEYQQKTYLVKITKREMITKCPTCEAILKEAKIQQEVKQWVEGGKNEYHQHIITKLFSRSGIPPRFTGKTLDTFVETTDNRANLATVRDYIANISLNLSLGRGLILFGDVGLGKSHLACAIAEVAISKHASALFISAADLVDDVKSAFSDNLSEKSKITNYIKPDLLIIDEIMANVNEYETKTLAKIINNRYEQKRSTILITNLEVGNDAKVGSLESVIGFRIIDRLRDTNKASKFTGKSWRGK